MNPTDTPAETLLFATEITVQVGDLNYGNHLANDAVLRLAHEVRLRWLAQGGYNEIDAGGSGLIMTEAAVRYLAQAFMAIAFIARWRRATSAKPVSA